MPKKYSPQILSKIPIFDINPTQLNILISNYLKQNSILIPIKDHDLIKTGFAKELAPEDKDWYYKRASSIFRAIVLNTMANNDIGTNYFGKKYCSKLNRGVKPSKMVRGGTGHVKAIIEDFVKKGWVMKGETHGYRASDEGLDVMKAFVEKIMN